MGTQQQKFLRWDSKMTDYTKNTNPIAFPVAGGDWTNVDGTSFTSITLTNSDTLTYTYKGKDTVYSYNTGKWTGPL